MLAVWVSLCALASLVHSEPQDLEESPPAICIANFCYSLRRESRKFNMARSICKNDQGDAMTVRTKVEAEAIAVLLRTAGSDPKSHFWLGLQLHQKTCPSESSLRSYRWVDGANTTNYANWISPSKACGPRCVTVSSDGGWLDRPCNRKAEGVLCEYRYNSSCRGLELGNGSVSYLTPFGTRSSKLSDLPPGTVALVAPWGIRLECNDSQAWVPISPGPWDCQVENGGCEHNCQTGSPLSCSCRPGHRLNEDGRSCAPVNPCEEERCAHHCQHLNGSAFCTCKDGYQLAADSKGCTDIDECKLQPCEQVCSNTPGSFTCSCIGGYRMSEEGKCEDINECYEGVCAHNCGNTLGSYDCTCLPGYETDPDNPTKCVFYCDTDPCQARCTGEGCECPVGFIYNDDARICQDINECSTDCLGHQCINNPGGFKCECRKGFEISEDGTSCDSEGSGAVLTETPTMTTFPPDRPARAGLSLGIVLGSIFVIAVLTLIVAGLGHHLHKKRGKWQTSNKYKSANVEEDVNLSQVTTGEDHKYQYSNDKSNVGT